MMKYKYILALLFLAMPCFGAPSLYEGIRYLKLANTYREAGDIDNALKYVGEGRAVISRQKGVEARYWMAVSEEFSGYISRDMNRDDEAAEHFDKALAAYRRLVKQKDGSSVPLELIKDKISKLSQPAKGYNKKTAAARVANLDNMKLKALPADIPESIENLSAVNNRLKEFPIGLASFKNLKYIDLSNNRIRNFSDVFMPKVEYMNLSSNRIKVLPVQIGEMTSLRVLDLSYNSLKSLPAGMCSLVNLKVLNLVGNKLPFEQVKELIRCLPNTNILHDRYEPVLEDEDATAGEEASE